MDLAALAEYKRTGDKRIRNRLVTDNMRIVYQCVYAFTHKRTLNRDLVQSGAIGLIEAIERFDLARLVDPSPSLFFAYAKIRIRHELNQQMFHDKGIRHTAYDLGITRDQIAEMLHGVFQSRTNAEYARAEMDRSEMLQTPTGTGPRSHMRMTETRSHEYQSNARLDIETALQGATPADVAVLIAYSEGAGPKELALALGLPPDRAHYPAAVERTRAAIERARRSLCGADAAE